MCCFSGPVRSVSSTSIFARALDGGRQALVYEMSLAADGDLAMVLPLPVPSGTRDDAVEFISLEGYPSFFLELEAAFPMEVGRGGPPLPSFAAPQAAPLVVHDVGAFEASFVPSIDAFARLDPRFRLSPTVLSALDAHRIAGFAVFKLKVVTPSADSPAPLASRLFSWLGGQRTVRERRFHPMALTFPRRDSARLFFPTVHVHDGIVHPTARFDHALYAQGPIVEDAALATWESSAANTAMRVDLERSRGLVSGDLPIRRRKLVGELPNADVWATLAGA